MKQFTISDELKQFLDNGKTLPVLNGLRGWAITFVILFHCAFNGPQYYPFPFNFFWQFLMERS